MKMIHRTLTAALTVLFLMLAGQVAEAGNDNEWPKRSQWGLQCLQESHCQSKKYNGKPAVCRKKVNTQNEWVSRHKYCLKALWKGAPCDNPNQCASGNCDRGRCEEKEIYVTEVDTDNVATLPCACQKEMDDLKQELNKEKKEVKELKQELANLSEELKEANTSCNWHGFDYIHIKPRDFFQISGDDYKLHTNYWDKGDAVELHDNFDVLAQYIIPKNCVPTKVSISMNEDCNGFDVYQNVLVQWPVPGTQGPLTPTKKILASKKFPSGIYDSWFTVVEAKIKDYHPCQNKGKSGPWENTWESQGLPTVCHPAAISIVIKDTGGDMCDVMGGYIQLEKLIVEMYD